MSNMSYCRFQNTAADLLDCEHHVLDRGLSKDERIAREKIVETCIALLENLGCHVHGEMGEDLGPEDADAILDCALYDGPGSDDDDDDEDDGEAEDPAVTLDDKS